MVQRGLLVVAGSTLSSVCYAVTIRAHLGLGPLFVVQDGLARRTGISIGTSVTITGLAFVVLALAFATRPGPGTLVLPFLGGATLNAVLPWIPNFSGIALRLLLVVLATLLMALGGAMVIRAAIGVAAYDLVMIAACKLFKRKVGPVRLVMELSMLTCGWLLGGAVGVGTVITGLLIGPSMQFWLRRLGVTAFTAAAPSTQR